ncbi:MAG: hypothetical protein ACYC27_01725 [Armatimonadota bacterium]
MSRYFILLTVLAIIMCSLINSVSADRLILTPTGRTLSTGGIKAEYAARTDGDGKAYWINFGISRLEIEGARFQDFNGDNSKDDVISAQIGIIPETTFTPALALGVRDIADETDGSNGLYEGRSLYVAASKKIPITGGVPFLFQDVSIHGGIGTNSLKGVFFGVEGTLPMGLRINGEYDTDDFNFAAEYSVIPTVKAKVSWIKGDIFYGANFSTSF